MFLNSVFIAYLFTALLALLLQAPVIVDRKYQISSLCLEEVFRLNHIAASLSGEQSEDEVRFLRSSSAGSPLLINGSTSMETVKRQSRLTSATLGRLEGQSQAQLKTWQHTRERHEQIALARDPSQAQDKMKSWLEELEKRIGGFGKI